MTTTAAPRLLLAPPTPLDELRAEARRLDAELGRVARWIGEEYLWYLWRRERRMPFNSDYLERLCSQYDQVERQMALLERRIDLWTDLERGANNP